MIDHCLTIFYCARILRSAPEGSVADSPLMFAFNTYIQRKFGHQLQSASSAGQEPDFTRVSASRRSAGMWESMVYGCLEQTADATLFLEPYPPNDSLCLYSVPHLISNFRRGSEPGRGVLERRVLWKLFFNLINGSLGLKLCRSAVNVCRLLLRQQIGISKEIYSFR